MRNLSSGVKDIELETRRKQILYLEHLLRLRNTLDLPEELRRHFLNLRIWTEKGHKTSPDSCGNAHANYAPGKREKQLNSWEISCETKSGTRIFLLREPQNANRESIFSCVSRSSRETFWRI